MFLTDRECKAYLAARALLVTTVLGLPAMCQVATAPTPTQLYQWRNVAIRGGGFVSGIQFSKKEKGLVYARTDVGGAYRSDDAGDRWRPITDFFSRKDSSYTGIESIAADPSDGNKVYLAAGLYSGDWGGPSAIFRSADKGRSWRKTPMTFKMGGNDDGRNCGEKLAVDPNLGSTLYFGSRRAGLWKSADSGATWAQVDSFPVKTTVTGPWDKVGISLVLFDPGKGKPGTATDTIYVGVAQADANLYRSTDAGATWALVAGTPKNMFPSHAVLDGKGQAYFTFINNIGPNGITDGAILKLDIAGEKWADVSPYRPGVGGLGKFGFGGLTIDAEHPETLMATTLDRWWPADGILRTTDGGKHWKELNTDATFSAQNTPWVYWHRDKTGGTGWMGDIAIDPFNPAKVMYTTGEGIWGTADATAADAGKPTHWGFPNDGLEEIVPLTLVSPPEGAHLLSGVGDVGGFRHDDVTRSPAGGFFFEPQFNNTDSIDYAENKPQTVVRVGRGDSKIVHGAWSTDGGTQWKAFATEAPTSKYGSGRVALAADASVVVWTPEKGDAYRSEDMGKSWTACAGLPAGSRVIADRVDAAKFYSFDDKTGKLFLSSDKAKTFTARAEPVAPGGRGAFLAAAPGVAGDLWVAAGDHLYHSPDGGTTFTSSEHAGKAYSVGFGKSAPGQTYPAIYLTGEVDTHDGIYRSDDAGKSWIRIDDIGHQYGWVRLAIGDPRVYGRVYLATGGRGIIYGDIYVKPTAPAAAVKTGQ